MNSDLYLATYHKFKNNLILDLPDIIFTSFINNKDELNKIIKSKFNLDKLIKYIINKKVKNRTQLILAIQEFFKEEHIELRNT